MDIKHLKFACAVARSGSINKAAQNLFVTQPHLSSCLKELEQEIGLTIFTRSAKGIHVTEDGMEFLEDAGIILHRFDDFSQKYSKNAIKKYSMYIISVRTVVPMLAYLDFYKQYYRDLDNYRLRFIETNFFSLIDACGRKEAQIGVIFYFTGQKDFVENYVRMRNLELCEIAKLPAHITLSRNNALLNKNKFAWDRIHELPCATYSDYMGSILNITNECKLINLVSPPKLVYVHDRHALLNTLSQTDAYAVSARFSAEDCALYGLTSLLLPSRASVHFGYLKIQKTSFPEGGMEARFLQCLEQTLSKFM
ncbi:MAG: LysR family transcriptional regulator [Desulfovibrio sp.]|jgi:DNA-binding transcriptional LysR family regulator|nr:LysR family transcriptional regulator [Desulfovibrio sp.]